MDLTNFVCVYLMICFSSDQISDGCPQNCDCYSAPEDGDGLNTAYSLICDWQRVNLIGQQRYDTLLDQSVNTFIIDKYDHGSKREEFPNGLKINNLVVRDSRILFSDLPLSNLDKNSLKVLTVINTDFDDTGPQTTFPEGFNELKAIFIRGGTFKKIGQHFVVNSMDSVISIMIDNTNLETIDDNALVNFKSLKMVTVMKNSIDSVNWLQIVDSPIWYLDLRNNKIREFPEALAKKLSKLRTLKLGGNNIHYISPRTINILMNNLNEFDFQQAKGMTKHTYFYPTEDMIWACTDTDCVKKVERYPKFLIEYLEEVKCIEWKQPSEIPCSHLGIEHFVYPKKAMSDKLVIINIKGQSVFSYRNEFTYVVGAELAIDFPSVITEDNLKYIEMLKQNGNIVKIVLGEFIFDQTMEPDTFDNTIKTIEDFMDLAESNGLFIIITLFLDYKWATNYVNNNNLMEGFIKNRLEILVKRFSKYNCVAAWNILDETANKIIDVDYTKPENEKCFNGNILSDNGIVFQLQQIQRFIARQAEIIHRIGHGQLVTTTIGFEYAIENWDKTNKGFNHFEDECLKLAMADICDNDDCVLDFYSLSFGITELDTYIDYEFYRNHIAKNSIKPVVISFNKDSDFSEFMKGFEDDYPWSINGVLAPTITSENFAIVTDGLNTFKEDYSEQISKLNQVNPILIED